MSVLNKIITYLLTYLQQRYYRSTIKMHESSPVAFTLCFIPSLWLRNCRLPLGSPRLQAGPRSTAKDKPHGLFPSKSNFKLRKQKLFRIHAYR